MNRGQKRAAATIALVALVIVTLFVLTLAFKATFSTLPGDTLPGKFYLAIMNDTGPLEKIFGTFFLVISVGISILGRPSTKDWMVYLTTSLCFVGILACAWLFLELRDPEIARPLWRTSSPPIGFDELQAGNVRLIGILVGWLAVFLATQLGIDVRKGGNGSGSRGGSATSGLASSGQDGVTPSAAVESDTGHAGETGRAAWPLR